MKFKLAQGVSIEADHPNDFLETLTSEERDEFYQCLACQDEVIKHVADQLIGGFTENGSFGSQTCGANVTPSTELDIATRRIAEASSDIAAKEIARLKREITRIQKNLDDANWKLQEREGRFV